MLRRSIAFLLNITASAFASALVSVFVMGSPIDEVILKIAIFSLALGVVLTVALEQESVLVFNWWWHRFWLEKELFEKYKFLIGRKLAPKLIKDMPGFPQNANIQVWDSNQAKDIIEVLQNKTTLKGSLPLVVSGQAGSGKSFAILQFSFLLCKTAMWRLGLFRPIPLLLFAEDFTGDLGQLIQDNLSFFLPGRKGTVLSKATDQLLRMGKFLIIIDGIEQTEETHRLAIARDIIKFSGTSAYKKNRYIFTCRSGYVDHYFDSKKMSYDLFEILPLTDDSVSHFISLYKTSKNDTQSIFHQLQQMKLLENNGLARNPYWLNLMLLEDAFNENPTIILGEAINKQITKEREKEGKKTTWKKIEPSKTQIFETRQLINYLAFELVFQGRYSVDYLDARKLIAAKIDSENFIELSPDDVIGLCQDAQILEETSLTSVGNQSAIKFRHSLILNFLAANTLIVKDSLVDDKFVTDLTSHPSKWWATLDMYGKLLATPEFRFYKQKRNLLPSKLEGKHSFNSALIKFCLFDPISVFTEKEDVKRVRESIVDEIIKEDLSDASLSSLSQVASMRPEEIIELINSINFTQANEPKVRRLVSYVVKQELQSGHVTSLLLKLTSQFPYHKLREVGEQDVASVDLYIIVKDVLIEIGDFALPVLFELLKIKGTFHIDLVLDVLGKSKNPLIIPELINLLSDEYGLPDDEVFLDNTTRLMKINDRLKACAFCFGEIGDPKSLGVLFTMLEVSEKMEIFGSGLEDSVQASIAKMGKEGAAALLMLASKKEETLVGLMSKIPTYLSMIGSPATPLLRQGLKHYNSSVRIVSIKALGLMRDEGSIDFLAEKLDDSNLFVRMDAVTALQLIGGKASRTLIKSTRRDIDVSGNYFKKVRNEKNALINLLITNALVKIGKDATPELIMAIDSENAQTQKIAIEVLGRIGDLDTLPALISKIQMTENISLINDLLFAIGGIGSIEAHGYLVEFLKSQMEKKNIYLGISAFIALSKLGETNATSWLIEFVAKGIGMDSDKFSKSMRYHAAVGLARARIKSGLEALESLKNELEKSTDDIDKKLLEGLNIQIKVITSPALGVDNIFWDLDTGVEYANRFKALQSG